MSEMKFYRYEAREYASLDVDGEFVSPIIPNPKLELSKYRLIKETPKGYWIGLESFHSDIWKKWVSKTSRKRFAYPSKEEALAAYIKRTEKRVKILKRQIRSCEITLGFAESLVNKLEIQK